MKKCLHALAASVSLSGASFAGTDVFFEPLTESTPVLAPNAMRGELSAPWVTPEGIAQRNLVSMREVEDAVLSPGQSIVRAENAGRNASMFDMIAYDPTGNYLFIPHETPWGAGVSRFDIYNRHNEVIFRGDGQGIGCADFVPEEPRRPLDYCPLWENDFAAFDPCRWTPNGTIFLGEEWSGLGRIVEVLNPLAPAHEVRYRVLESIANVAHEGINFSKKFSRCIFYIDEWRSGSVYKFHMNRAGNYTRGQTFVLSVDEFIASGGVASDNYNEQAEGVVRTGMATWIPITSRRGEPLEGITDPFRDGPTNDPRENVDTRGGRPAADDVGGTPYGRPEDMVVSTLANGNEAIFFTATSESKVYCVEMLETEGGLGGEGYVTSKAIVREFVSLETPKNVGFPETTGVLNSPDNLAIDALGNIYIIEDSPNGSDTGGDIWFCRDTDNDGVAESIDHFMSIGVDGSESTGMIFNPTVPTEFVMAVQHPDSTNLANVPDGLGDAVWQFDLSLIPNQDFVDALNEAGAARGHVLVND